MEDSTKIRLKNRAHCPIVYFVPDMGNLRREFSPLEEKIITFEELRKLNNTPGGAVLLKQDLIIRDSQAIEELNLQVEPEYYYEKEDVDRLLKDGTYEEFLDCLDFAPMGVIDLLKQQAVALPLNDVRKREALLERYDFDVAKTLQIRKITNEGQEEKEVKTTQRRAAAPSGKSSGSKTESTGARRVVKETKE